MEQPEEFIGQKVTAVPSPAFLVDLAKVKNNCQRMLDKCSLLGVQLRPHVKTHKTIEGALIQTGGRKSAIVVSTIAEAWFYADAGFTDIILGTPVTEHILQRCRNLCKKALIHFLVNSENGVEAVQKISNENLLISTLIKISTGYERAGIHWEDSDAILKLASELTKSPNVRFQGIYVHCGNSYTTDKSAIQNIRDESVTRLVQIKQMLEKSGVACQSVGIGSTPSCSLDAELKQLGITEFHPGNYAFYDCQQESYGACGRADIAVRVMTRVRSHKPERNQILVDLGFTGLTKQGLDLAVPGYGAVQGQPNLKLVAMTQELGKIESVDGSKIKISDYPIDSPLYIFPYHACATSAMYGHYYVHDENGHVIAVWRPTRGW